MEITEFLKRISLKEKGPGSGAVNILAILLASALCLKAINICQKEEFEALGKKAKKIQDTVVKSIPEIAEFELNNNGKDIFSRYAISLYIQTAKHGYDILKIAEELSEKADNPFSMGDISCALALSKAAIETASLQLGIFLNYNDFNFDYGTEVAVELGKVADYEGLFSRAVDNMKKMSSDLNC